MIGTLVTMLVLLGLGICVVFPEIILVLPRMLF